MNTDLLQQKLQTRRFQLQAEYLNHFDRIFCYKLSFSISLMLKLNHPLCASLPLDATSEEAKGWLSHPNASYLMKTPTSACGEDAHEGRRRDQWQRRSPKWPHMAFNASSPCDTHRRRLPVVLLPPGSWQREAG